MLFVAAMRDLLPPKIIFERGKSEIGDRNTRWGRALVNNARGNAINGIPEQC